MCSSTSVITQFYATAMPEPHCMSHLVDGNFFSLSSQSRLLMWFNRNGEATQLSPGQWAKPKMPQSPCTLKQVVWSFPFRPVLVKDMSKMGKSLKRYQKNLVLSFLMKSILNLPDTLVILFECKNSAGITIVIQNINPTSICFCIAAQIVSVRCVPFREKAGLLP